MENERETERDQQPADSLADAADGGHPTPEYFVGRRTRELREERGWSQAELGRRLAAYGFDMHQSTVAKLENSVRPIRYNEIDALAEIFGVHVMEMIGVGDANEEFEQAGRIREARRIAALLYEAQGLVLKLEADARVVTSELEHARARLAELREQAAEVGHG